MTTEMCVEDVVIPPFTPQITEQLVTSCGGEGDIYNNVVVGQSRGGIGGIELGRRLLLAARAGDTDTVLDLMAKGAPFTTDWLGTSPLHLAAANGHAETCGVLLRAGVSRDARTKVERTPLHLAAHAGHARVVELLLQWGASPHARDLLLMTPLHWAAARGHAQVARALLRAGAEPRARCKFRKMPRCHAARQRHHQMLALLDAAEADAQAAALREEMAEETPKVQPELEIVQKVQDIKQRTNVIKPSTEKPLTENIKPQEARAAGAGDASAAALLRAHGITLLPPDDGGTVLSALQSGRTIVLSDAGKLMLKESGSTDPGSVASGVGLNVGGAASPAGVTTRPKGVVVRATPVRSPPRGVKVFALHNKLAGTPQQVKIVQLADVKSTTGPKVTPLKAKGRAPAVKIIMNKASLNKLLASQPTQQLNQQRSQNVRNPVIQQINPRVSGITAETVVETGGESVKALRAQLETALATIRELQDELNVTRARLARYEPPDH